MTEPRYKIRNWDKFQHYKNRKPPWIRLYTELLDDPEWMELDAELSKLVVNLWLMAAGSVTGELPKVRKMAYRLRIASNSLVNYLEKLQELDYIELSNDASSPRAVRGQHALPETETEGETEAEADTEGERDRAHLRTDPFSASFDSLVSEVVQAADEILFTDANRGRFIPTRPSQRSKYPTMAQQIVESGWTVEQWREYFEFCVTQTLLGTLFQPTLVWLTDPDHVPEVQAGKYAGEEVKAKHPGAAQYEHL